MRGWVEKVENGLIEGWIVYEGDQRDPLKIAILIDNRKVTEGVASIFRQDLVEKGSPTGLAGFSLPFDASHHANNKCVIRVVEVESGWEVPPGQITFDPVENKGDEADVGAASNDAYSPIEGGIDSLTPWGASGWARFTDGREEAVRVEALLNGIVVRAALAHRPRPDLDDDERKNKFCGFVFQFDRLLPSDVVLTVRAIGTRGAAILFRGKPRGIEGYVDSVAKWGASGWAWAPLDIGGALSVEARLGDRVIASAITNQLREDIRESGRGTGYCGFTLKFDPPLSEGNSPDFVAIGDSETLHLASSEMVELESQADMRCPEPASAAEMETVSTVGLEIEGNVDTITSWLASGWVWRPSAPGQALEVEALLNGQVIGRATADQLRPDLAEYSKGTSRYGFVLSFSSPLENETPPILRVAMPEGAVVVPNHVKVRLDHKKPPAPGAAPEDKPKSEPSPLLVAVEGHVDQMTRRDAVGWAWFPSAPERPVQIEAILDGKVIGRALADQFRPDLAQHGKGTGLYGFKIKFGEPVTGAAAPEFRALPVLGRLLSNESRLPPVLPNDLIKRASGSFSDLFDEHSGFTAKGPLFEEFDETILTRLAEGENAQPKPMLVAFYLPQFHPIEENDRFWGKGFTEWRQLAKGMPRFPGHYQPRIPRDLGFYNLENLEDLRKQVAMAKASGIHGFAYYYYWFNRRRVLERPLESLLKSDVDMPFMLIWANENWTRTWDGSESQILLKQDYNAEDEDALIDDLARHLRDPRYIRLNNRPLFVIYNPNNVPDSAQTIQRWREKLTARIGVEPLMFMAQTFGELDPRPHGLDGALEFPPHKLSNHLPGRPTPDAYSPEFAGRVIAFDDFVKASLDEDEPEDYPLIKTVVPSWDNDSRRPNRGLTLEGIAPQKYQSWLRELITRAIDTPIAGTPIVAINAWNEWAESAYLEPDVYFGSAFLNATARAYVSAVNARVAAGAISELEARPRLSVIFPNFNHAKYLTERIQSVLNQTVPPDEIIFLDDSSSDNSVEIARELLAHSRIPYRIIVNEKNSGGVFRQWMKGLSLAQHELIWVAETDDSVDRRFLSNILPAFARDDVMAAFGRITCIDHDGAPRGDLDNYFDDLKDFSWSYACVVPAYQAFSNDFAIKNVIPNASGLVFRKPKLTEEEQARLFQYRFAGDWYFYALVARGGAVAYCRRARSFFRVNQTSASRSSFFTERHLAEHQMVIQDLSREYAIGEAVVKAHSDALAQYLTDRSPEALSEAFLRKASDESDRRRMRVCVAANGFAVGGGEILPAELANKLKDLGLHVTYLVIERPKDARDDRVRKRLRPDIPVIYWDDVCNDFPGFVAKFGIQLINSHNVSVDFRVFLRDLRLNIPYVVSLHGGYETVPGLLTPEFLSYLSERVSKWLYLSKKNIEFLPTEVKNDQKLLHSFNAVPDYAGEWIDRTGFRQQHAIATDAFVFVQCSRAIEAKGWRTSIQIVEQLSTPMKRPLHLVLIGDGAIAADLQNEYAGSGLVTFLGQIDTPVRYLKCFDMGLFPSIFEGETFPLFLLECFAVGLPVISTDIGEISRMMEGVDGQRPGMTVDYRKPSEELVGNFAAKLEEMFNTLGAYQSFVDAAHVTSGLFSMDALGHLYYKIFEEILEPKLQRSHTVVSESSDTPR